VKIGVFVKKSSIIIINKNKLMMPKGIWQEHKEKFELSKTKLKKR